LKNEHFFYSHSQSYYVDLMSEESVDREILQELQKIRESLAKPAPPAPQQTPPRGLIDEFVQFLNKYGVMGLAIAFIMGGAVSNLVSALVKDIIMPVITFFIPDGEWQTYILRLGPIQLLVGHFVGALLDFLIIALVIFTLMKQLKKTPLN
jgi:large conductance mechanosensitive channel